MPGQLPEQEYPGPGLSGQLHCHNGNDLPEASVLNWVPIVFPTNGVGGLKKSTNTGS